MIFKASDRLTGEPKTVERETCKRLITWDCNAERVRRRRLTAERVTVGLVPAKGLFRMLDL